MFSGQTLLMDAHTQARDEARRNGPCKPRSVTDNDITHLIEWLEANGCKGKVSPRTVDDAVQAEAERNQFSSARQALDRLDPWDGIYRLEKFWLDVCGAEGYERDAR